MIQNISRSLTDLLGASYMEAVKNSAVALLGMDPAVADALAEEKVDFFPETFAARCDALAAKAGQQILPAMGAELEGAPTESFRKATNVAAAPVGGIGCVRIGQNGKVYIAAKSEHYHIPLGHNFPGYQLITKARQLGILNATHNNTRGYITRLMEQKIIMDANGLQNAGEALDAVLQSKEPKVLNRLINLETGSLAVEAGLKMMLTRFYCLDRTQSASKYQGKTPVFLVMEDNDGGLEANYHGTTVLAQTLRGMWPQFRDRCEQAGIYKVVSVKRNDAADFAEKIRRYNTGEFKTAGFFHEIILMNYGGIRLTPEYLQAAYALCEKYDTPTLCDEIQSCMWYEGMFLFRQYGLHPDFVIIGKGFPGGEYPASKVITTYEMDTLNQFGALVTNGQEELASLAYLITMEFVRENGKTVSAMGSKIQKAFERLVELYPDRITCFEGLGHMGALHFANVDIAKQVGQAVNRDCVDVSAQLYKANCPPAILIKLPLITSDTVLEIVIQKMTAAIKQL